jgi:ribonuclease VapC
MIVDTSAILAILFGEPEARAFATAIADAPRCAISAGSWVELAAVSARRGHVLDAQLTRLVERAGLQIEPVSEDQAKIGAAAYRSFGRGSRHPARLNFGDCFAYALAKATGEPLLFKGDDFVHTDVTAAL